MLIAPFLVARNRFNRLHVQNAPAGFDVENFDARPVLTLIVDGEPIARKRNRDDPGAFRDFE